ncbi:ATP-binding cassette sub- G member 2 [Geranomyces variabilis]|uniref:ATP-binding cassette sub- G member 2 n=1 Tax=Geranomyces variabilis TaxID=109894 RepID=A0AAD5XLS8_9FUNG|nr:ATP-binding cassette sub- G member 2 [Geranomyces variabilis]
MTLRPIETLALFATSRKGFNFAMPVAILFPTHKTILMRERAGLSYRVSTFFISKLVAELPLAFAWTIIFNATVYWMMHLQRDVSKFLLFQAINLAIVWACIGLGMIVGAASPSVEVAQMVAPLSVVLFVIFSGFLVSSNDLLPVFVWIQYLSPLYYGFRALMQNEFRGLTFSCPPDPSERRAGPGEFWGQHAVDMALLRTARCTRFRFQSRLVHVAATYWKAEAEPLRASQGLLTASSEELEMDFSHFVNISDLCEHDKSFAEVVNGNPAHNFIKILRNAPAGTFHSASKWNGQYYSAARAYLISDQPANLIVPVRHRPTVADMEKFAFGFKYSTDQLVALDDNHEDAPVVESTFYSDLLELVNARTAVILSSGSEGSVEDTASAAFMETDIIAPSSGKAVSMEDIANDPVQDVADDISPTFSSHTIDEDKDERLCESLLKSFTKYLLQGVAPFQVKNRWFRLRNSTPPEKNHAIMLGQRVSVESDGSVKFFEGRGVSGNPQHDGIGLYYEAKRYLHRKSDIAINAQLVAELIALAQYNQSKRRLLCAESFVVGIHHRRAYLVSAQFSINYLANLASSTGLIMGDYLLLKKSPEYDLASSRQRKEFAALFLTLVNYLRSGEAYCGTLGFKHRRVTR